MKSCKRQMYAAGVLAIFWLFVGLGCAGSEKNHVTTKSWAR